MSIDMQPVNVAMEITCFLFSVTLAVSMLIIKANKTKLTRIFFWMVILNSAVVLCDAAAWWFAGWPGAEMNAFLMLVNFLVYTFSYVQYGLTAYYIIVYLRLRHARIGKWYFPILLVNIIILMGMVIATQFNGEFYYIDSDNIFQLGPLYGVLYLFTMTNAIILSIFAFAHRKHFIRKEWGAILFYILSMLAALVIEIFLPDIMFVNAMIAISLVALFVLVHFQQEIEFVELENSYKTSIMLSQIQPHFLYNTLATIEDLCLLGKAERSAEALHTFSKYLRFNMDSLSKNATIPFDKELEHVSMFLEISMLRFRDRLTVEYDIRAREFWLPALSLQLIVENAVRHGVTKRDGGGTVAIRSEETSEGWLVTVADDGVGFDQGADVSDEGSHLGIKNVRQRLEVMSGGRLDIQSTPGVGTTATITIPKERR